jgi:outer membrane protein OmpA-like peptidoglycan-associated protein
VDGMLIMREVLFRKNKNAFFLFLLIPCLFMVSCASSDVSRDVSAGVDQGMQNANHLVSGIGSSDLADTYQNTSQMTKGAVMGGAAGVLTGMFSSVPIVPATAAGAIVGASYGAYIDAHTTLQDQLENRGATVVVLGDQVLVVLPSARLFQSMTAHIKPQAYSTLDLVVRYINRYTKTLVQVAAYTNATGPQSIDLALSQQQAESVVKYLSAAGVDARLLFAIGYGGAHLVERNAFVCDGSDNDRIEITFEKLYV